MRILAMILGFACLVVLLLSDLNLAQRWLIAGLMVFQALANWDRE